MPKRIYWVLLSLVVALALIAPGAAAHTTIIEPEGSHFPYQQWADEAKIPTPDVTITVVETGMPNGCPGPPSAYAGCTSPSEGMIWLAPEAIAHFHARETFYHELGHNVDADILFPWMRERFMVMLGLSGPWVTEGEPKPANSPDEIFADVYAQCAYKPVVAAAHLGVGPVFGSQPIGGRRTYNAICRMLVRL